MLNIRGSRTGRLGLGSKSNPIGVNLQGVKTSKIGESGLEADLSANELVEMIELEDEDVPLACKCGTVPIGLAYKNIPNLNDLLNHVAPEVHDKVKRYSELKQRHK